MSYAEVAAMGSEQTPEEAAAPQPAEIVVEDSISTSSLVDVDAPSVRTVPSDFLDQEVQTDTQASRIEREQEAEAATQANADAAAAAAKRKAEAAKGAFAKLHNCITSKIESMSDGAVAGTVLANLVGVVGVGAWLGYKGWRLQEQGRLSWKTVGIGAGVFGAVSIVEAVFGGYLYKSNRVRAVGKKE